VLAEAGANATLKKVEPPGATKTGSVKPEMENPVPEIAAWETLSPAVPGF